jgi:XTP/dITP diphosphohydrolase
MTGRGASGSRFRSVVAIAAPTGEEAVVEGVVEGRITEAPRGRGGFGYDPVFLYVPAGRTFAEMSEEVKNAVSHRAQGLAAARALLWCWPAGARRPFEGV